MRTMAIILAALLTLAAGTAWGAMTPEYRIFGGAYIPTGSQADMLKSSMLVGVQGGAELSRKFHLIGTLAYATPRTKDRLDAQDVHLYQYDAGAEYFHVFQVSENAHWSVRPFLGAGAGARTYDIQHSDIKMHTDFTGYGSVGAEFQHVNIAARLEVRDYWTRFNGFSGSQSAKDYYSLVVGGGFAYHF